MTIREGIPLRAARLALDEAITYVRRSVAGNVSGDNGADGERLVEEAKALALRIQDAVGYWIECREYHNEMLANAGKGIKGGKET